jgi:hypothetical protein
MVVCAGHACCLKIFIKKQGQLTGFYLGVWPLIAALILQSLNLCNSF